MTAESLLSADEEPPVEVFNPGGRAAFVIVCDHAGRALPRSLGTLGLSAEALSSHIGWDLGAAAVARRLGKLLDAPVFCQRYSRLVIDCNRPLGAADSIPSISGGISIPGNQQLTAESATQRVREIFAPYHGAIAAALAQRSGYQLVSMHSFTPELYGVKRPFHAGVLYADDSRFAQPVLQLLRDEPGLVVGDNEPYAASRATDYAIIEYGELPGAPYVELEVRQDLIADEAGQLAWSERLARVIRAASAKLS